MRRPLRLAALLFGVLIMFRITPLEVCALHAGEHCAAMPSHSSNVTSCHGDDSSPTRLGEPVHPVNADPANACCQMMTSCSTPLFSVTAAPAAPTADWGILAPETPPQALHSLVLAPDSPPPRA